MTQARRWMAEDFGGPEVLNEVLVDLPEPGTGDVTVEVRTCGMNPADYKHLAPDRTRAACPSPLATRSPG